MNLLENLKLLGYKPIASCIEYKSQDIDLLNSHHSGLTTQFELIVEELLNMQKVLPWHKIKDHMGIVSFNFQENFQIAYSKEDLSLVIRKDNVNIYCISLIYNINHANAFMLISIFFTIASLENQLFKRALIQIYSNFVFLEEPTESETIKINQNLLFHNLIKR